MLHPRRPYLHVLKVSLSLFSTTLRVSVAILEISRPAKVSSNTPTPFTCTDIAEDLPPSEKVLYTVSRVFVPSREVSTKVSSSISTLFTPTNVTADLPSSEKASPPPYACLWLPLDHQDPYQGKYIYTNPIYTYSCC